MDFTLRISNLCFCLLVLTLRVENKTPHTEYWCQWGSVQDDLCCTCFLIDCLLQLHAMKKDFIHHPPVMSFYMQTQFGVQASQMGCLWKRQRLSSNHSLLCDCTAGLERNEADARWRMGEGRSVLGVEGSSIRCIRGPFLQASSSTCRAHAGSMIKLFHMVAQTNVLPLKCRQQSWCELCMCANELCCRMLLWWLPSLLGIDPSRVKTGRKEKGDQQQQQNSVALYRGITWSSRSFQRCSLKLLWTVIWITSTLFFFHWINVNPSMKMGIIHSCFAFGSFGSCL